ncbi:MAG TPA: hypothetical protein DF613_12735 [Lachnospiraceae bacterium]|nr:hypothetical protein [Lachnospiraceae bacterium]
MRLPAEFFKLWFSQAVIDYLLFDCLCAVWHHSVPIWRKLLAVILELFVFWVLLLSGASWKLVVFGSLIVEGGLLRLVWGTCGFFAWLGAWAGKFMLTVLLGGICLGTALLAGRTFQAMYLPAALILAVVVRILTAIEQQKTGRRIFPVGLAVRGCLVWTKGLYDTGNCLYDGSRQVPVSIVSRQLIREDFPELEICLEKFMRGENTRSLAFHYVPYKSLGCPEGMLLCFTAEYLILGENGRKGMTMHPRIAVSENSALFGPAYQMILNPDVLQE